MIEINIKKAKDTQRIGASDQFTSTFPTLTDHNSLNLRESPTNENKKVDFFSPKSYDQIKRDVMSRHQTLIDSRREDNSFSDPIM